MYRIFDPDVVARQLGGTTKAPRLLTRLEWIRNSLVLVPVMVTWLGIWLAVNAYSSAVRSDPELANQPFLLLWQNGFDGRLSWLTLGHLALVDGALIAIVLALTVTVYGVSNYLESRKEDQVDQIRYELSTALAGASICLARWRFIEPGQFVSQFEKVADNIIASLGSERERLVALAQEREKQFHELATFSEGLVQGAGKMLAATQNLDHLYQQISTSIHALSTSTEALAVSQEELVEATNNIAGRVEVLLGQQEMHSSQLQEGLEVVSISARQISDTAASVADIGRKLMTAQTELLDALTKDQNAQVNVAKVVSEAAIRVESTLNEVHQYSTTFHGLAVDLADLSRQLPEVSRKLQSDLSVLVATHTEASKQMVGAATTIELSAQAVQSVVNNLAEAQAGVISDGRILASVVSALHQRMFTDDVKGTAS